MWWSAALALALAVNPHLDEGRRLYERLKYPDAEARLRVAAQVPDNSPDEQAQIADLLARSLMAQGRSAEAEKVYAELLARLPDAADPVGASPKVRDVFLKAKLSVYPAGFVRLERRASAASRLEVELVDPWRQVTQVVLSTERDGQRAPAQPMAMLNRRASAEVTVAAGQSARCTVEARDASGTVLAQLGTADAPLVFRALSAPAAAVAPGATVEAAAGPKGPTRWPAILVGALAVGAAAAGTGLAISASNDYRQVTPETDALTTRQLDQRAHDKALAANVTLGGAVVAGVVTGVLVWSW